MIFLYTSCRPSRRQCTRPLRALGIEQRAVPRNLEGKLELNIILNFFYKVVFVFF